MKLPAILPIADVGVDLGDSADDPKAPMMLAGGVLLAIRILAGVIAHCLGWNEQTTGTLP